MVHRLLDRLMWGLRYGMAFGSAFSFLGVVIFLLNGWHTSAVIGVDLFAVIAFYLVGGVVAGLLLGIFKPLVKWRAGAAAVGVLIAVPVLEMTQILFEGLHVPNAFELREVMTVGVLMGVVVGIGYYEIFSNP